MSLSYDVTGTTATVQIDWNHDTIADATLVLYNVTSLVAGDFIL